MDIQKMMKQMQQMQLQMQQAQADLGNRVVCAAVAGDRVVVTANGHGDIQSIRIAREVVNPDDVELLQDLVLAALQKLQAEAKSLTQAELGKVAGGLGIPGLGL